MTRCPFAIWTPASADPQYPDGKYYPRSLTQITMIVNHDAVGGRAYLRQGQRPGEEASWLFSNLTDGILLQHYEMEQGTWTSGGKTANVTGVAVEHESVYADGRPSTTIPFTPQQVATDLRLYAWVKSVAPNLRPPVLGQGWEEHRRLSGGTTCPNNRTSTLYAANQPQPAPIPAPMPQPTPVEENDMRIFKTIDAGVPNNYYSVGAGYKHHINDMVELYMSLRAARQTVAEDCYQVEMDVFMSLDDIIVRAVKSLIPAPISAVIFKNTATGQHALQGEMGSAGIGHAGHLKGLIAGGAIVVNVDDATFTSMQDVRGLVRQEAAAAIASTPVSGLTLTGAQLSALAEKIVPLVAPVVAAELAKKTWR